MTLANRVNGGNGLGIALVCKLLSQQTTQRDGQSIAFLAIVHREAVQETRGFDAQCQLLVGDSTERASSKVGLGRCGLEYTPRFLGGHVLGIGNVQLAGGQREGAQRLG